MITVGQQLGAYTILKRIGGGQMGEVFLAQHRRIARRAAIKTLIPELSAKETVIERFFKEARNTSQIRNPAIVEILDCDVHEGQAYVIMEFLEGESLGTYLKRAGALEPDMAFLLGVMGATASAVGAAHDVGILHRDLKPENIYLQLAAPSSPTVTVKALDFGIAQLSRDDGGPSKTKSGVLLGSPAYMSPEQCRGSGKTDERTDIYSLGCVLYEALCGRPPYTSRSLGDLIMAHVSEPLKAPIKLVPDVPPKLNALILKMLAKAPDDRPASMKVVVDALRDCARALGIDFEAPLEPLIPVERPVLMAEGAPAVAIPTEPSKAPAYQPRTSPSQPAPPVAAPAVPAPVAPAFSAPVVSAPVVSAPVVSAPALSAGPAPVAPPVPAPNEDQRQPAFARPPASEGVPSAPVFPEHSAGAVERTLILAPVNSRETGDPLNRLKGLVGQTVMMPEDEMKAAPGNAAGKASPSSKAAKAPEAGRAGSRATPDEAPRGLAGGTQVLGAFGNAGADSIDDQQDDDEDEDADESDDRDQASRETDHVKAPRGGRAERKARNAMAAAGTPPAGVPANIEPPPSSFADFARANQSLFVIAGGAVVLAIAILAILLSRPNKPAAVSKEAPPAQPAAPPVPEKEPTKEPPKEAKQEPDQPPATTPVNPAVDPAAKVVPPVEDNVRITLKRVPEGTEISVDGHPTALPILIPRGRDTHQIILRAPDGTERSLDVDGTRDRLIELAVPRPPSTGPRAPVPAPPHAPAPGAVPKAPLPVRPPATPPKEAAAAPPKVPTPVRPPATAPKEAPAAHVPAAPKPSSPSTAAPAPAAPARPSASPAATSPADKKPKPRVSKEREAIIDL